MATSITGNLRTLGTYGYDVGNTIEKNKNASVFSLIRMRTVVDIIEGMQAVELCSNTPSSSSLEVPCRITQIITCILLKRIVGNRFSTRVRCRHIRRCHKLQQLSWEISSFGMSFASPAFSSPSNSRPISFLIFFRSCIFSTPLRDVCMHWMPKSNYTPIVPQRPPGPVLISGLLNRQPAVTFPASERHRRLTGTSLYCLVNRGTCLCEQLG